MANEEIGCDAGDSDPTASLQRRDDKEPASGGDAKGSRFWIMIKPLESRKRNLTKGGEKNVALSSGLLRDRGRKGVN